MFPGKSIRAAVQDIIRLVAEYDAKTLLDYGCGQGDQYAVKKVHKKWGILPTLYDPASKRHRIKPTGQFDGVICTDVLEHIPEDELDDALTEIFGYAKKFVVLSIATGPAHKKFDDGTNLHVTIKPEEWWRTKLSRFPIPTTIIFQKD